MDKKYNNINYRLLMLLLTPPSMRNNLINHFIGSLATPLDTLQNEFSQFREGLNTKNNSQICYMQAMLNDEFDFYERRIKVKISDLDIDFYLLWSESKNKFMMLNEDHNEDMYLISSDGLIGINNTDFEIVLPIGFTLSQSEQNKMTQLVNKNKLASKKFKITHG